MTEDIFFYVGEVDEGKVLYANAPAEKSEGSRLSIFHYNGANYAVPHVDKKNGSCVNEICVDKEGIRKIATLSLKQFNLINDQTHDGAPLIQDIKMGASKRAQTLAAFVNCVDESTQRALAERVSKKNYTLAQKMPSPV